MIISSSLMIRIINTSTRWAVNRSENLLTLVRSILASSLLASFAQFFTSSASVMLLRTTTLAGSCILKNWVGTELSFTEFRRWASTTWALPSAGHFMQRLTISNCLSSNSTKHLTTRGRGKLTLKNGSNYFSNR